MRGYKLIVASNDNHEAHESAARWVFIGAFFVFIAAAWLTLLIMSL